MALVGLYVLLFFLGTTSFNSGPAALQARFVAFKWTSMVRSGNLQSFNLAEH